jgi:hypothetical protein
MIGVPHGTQELWRLGWSAGKLRTSGGRYTGQSLESAGNVRPVVRHHGVPVPDIVQVWLDVSNHASRGKEQAEQIWKRVLAPSGCIACIPSHSASTICLCRLSIQTLPSLPD